MSRDRPPWFKSALQVRLSVIPSILPRVLLCGGFGVFISLLHFFKLPVSLPILSSIVPSIVLGLLLVFRTNTAYDRFWEGRKFWGMLINNVRNLARRIWVAIEEKDPQDIELKKSALRLLPAFAVAMKLHLRQEAVNPELEPLMSPAQYQKLKSMNNPPLEIAFWIEDYLHEQYERNCLDVYQLSGMKDLISSMIDVLGGCERILKTPIPLAYAIHLKQLLLLYCLALPFQMVNDLAWGTAQL